MIVGIPNVGKSTVINTLAGKKKAAAANQPGVTKDMQHVPISRELQVLDTPGILWHKFDDQLVGLKLGVLGSIKDSVLLLDQIALEALRFMSNCYSDLLIKRYKLKDQEGQLFDASRTKEIEPHILLDMIARNRGLLLPGGDSDTERTARMLLKELRDGIIGPISLEKTSDPSCGWEFIQEEQ